MVKESDYRINDFYQGGYSTFKPDYSAEGIYTGAQIPASQLGAPTKPDTANQIAQVSMLLNQGIVPIEVGALSPEVFDQIPKQHFKEINRMAKLAGSDISVHAPIIEASGIGDQGYSESARKLAEEQFKGVIDKTAPMNEAGGMSITIHGAAKIPGKEYKIDEHGKKVVEKIYVVNRETGKVSSAFEEEKKFYPSTKDWEKGTVHSPEIQIDILNHTEWDNSISQLMHHKEDAESRINENLGLIPEELMGKILQEAREGKSDTIRLLGPTQREAYSRITAAQQFLGDTQQSLSGLFNKAYKFGSDDDRETLKKASEKFKEDAKQGFLIGEAKAVENMLVTLKSMQPEVYQDVEKFAIDKSADTFANIALHAVNEYKDKAPTINVENLFPGMAFSHGEELDNLIKTSRKKFVERATAQGVSQSKAEEQAEKVIGVTLDVGHLNIAKKKGFKDKDLLKEMEQIAKHVKHVHLTDNFGYSDSHLSPGMGNVPIKEILERLEKEGYEGKKIVEAGGLVQHFGKSPLPYMLEAFGSPIYQGGPQWNQAIGLYQSYSGGFGQMLPSINYETFGAGWSNLPAELGGSRAGAQGSRMSGKGME